MAEGGLPGHQGGGDADSASADAGDRQVQVRFETQLPAGLRVPATTFAVPASLTRYGLSEVVNTLLGLAETPKPFDFVIEGKLLRTSLHKCLLAHGLSAESVVPVEYTLAAIPPNEFLSLPHDDWVSAVRCYAANGVVATGSYDCVVRLFSLDNSQWGAAGGGAQDSLYGEGDAGEGAAVRPFSPADSGLTHDHSGRGASFARLSAAAECCGVLRGPTDAVTAVAVSSVAASGQDESKQHDEGCASLHVYGAAKDGRVCMWEVRWTAAALQSQSHIREGEKDGGQVQQKEQQRRQQHQQQHQQHQPAAVFKGHKAAVHSLDVCDAVGKGCSGSWDGKIHLWPLRRKAAGGGEDAEGEEEEGMDVGEGGAGGTKSAKGAKGLGGKRRKVGADGSVLSSPEEIESDAVLEGHTEAVSALVWAPPPGHDSNEDDDGAVGDSGWSLCSGSWDHSIRLWDPSTSACVHTLRMAHPVLSVAARGGGSSQSLVAAGAANSTLRLWDVRAKGSTAPAMQLLSHKSWITAVRWCPANPLLLLSCSYDGTAKLWDVRGTVPLHTVEAHEAHKVLSGDWWDGRSFATGGSDSKLNFLRQTV